MPQDAHPARAREAPRAACDRRRVERRMDRHRFPVPQRRRRRLGRLRADESAAAPSFVCGEVQVDVCARRAVPGMILGHRTATHACDVRGTVVPCPHCPPDRVGKAVGAQVVKEKARSVAARLVVRRHGVDESAGRPHDRERPVSHRVELARARRARSATASRRGRRRLAGGARVRRRMESMRTVDRAARAPRAANARSDSDRRSPRRSSARPNRGRCRAPARARRGPSAGRDARRPPATARRDGPAIPPPPGPPPCTPPCRRGPRRGIAPADDVRRRVPLVGSIPLRMPTRSRRARRARRRDHSRTRRSGSRARTVGSRS